MEILELKSTMTEMKNSEEGFNREVIWKKNVGTCG